MAQNFSFAHSPTPNYFPADQIFSAGQGTVVDGSPALNYIENHYVGTPAGSYAMFLGAYQNPMRLKVPKLLTTSGNFYSATGEPLVYAFRVEFPFGSIPADITWDWFVANGEFMQMAPIVSNNGLHACSWEGSVPFEMVPFTTGYTVYFGILVLADTTLTPGTCIGYASARIVDEDYAIYQPNK